MPYMTRIPSDLARFGLKVELVPGWETRGSSSFAPACVVDHWTAGPRGTTGRPSLNVVTYGRAGLPGPLCNIYLDRRGVCVVVAAGRANHAGLGGFRGLVGNSAAYGIEAECGGDGDWTDEMLDAYPRLNAALLSGLGRDASWVAGHNEWAPTRKIDIRDIIASVRARTGAILANPTEDDMPLSNDDIVRIHAFRYQSPLSKNKVSMAVMASADLLHSYKSRVAAEQALALMQEFVKTGQTLSDETIARIGADVEKRLDDNVKVQVEEALSAEFDVEITRRAADAPKPDPA